MLTLCPSGWNPTSSQQHWTSARDSVIIMWGCLTSYMLEFIAKKEMRVLCKVPWTGQCNHRNCWMTDFTYKTHKWRCALSLSELAFVCLPQKCLKMSPLDSYETLKQHCRCCSHSKITIELLIVITVQTFPCETVPRFCWSYILSIGKTEVSKGFILWVYTFLDIWNFLLTKIRLEAINTPVNLWFKHLFY